MEGPLRTMSIEALAQRVGTEVGTSDWFRIDQGKIDAFAELTQDHYFIHVDPARAASTRFGGTVAHGFLTLSMLAPMAYQACPAVEGTKTAVNYGFNRLRFVAPVPAGSRIRGRFVLRSFEVQGGGRWQSIFDVAVEIEGEPKPALVAEWISAGFL
ncbi:MAG TPA: MaoC family dehydratase [Burkholderiales bacterium]|nr:MaoC family dehydratase [Burkholderiales bacterium]